MVKVLWLWDVPARLQNYLAGELANEVELIFPQDLSEEKLCELVQDVEVLVGWNPSVKLLAAAKELVLFINPGAGVEHQITKFQEFPAVTLVNSHGNSYAVAQHALAMLLTLTNQIIPHHQWMRDGIWRTNDADAKSYLLRRKCLGLLGFGAIGQHFARFSAGFELERIVYKRRSLKEVPEYINQVYIGDDFEEFLRKTDILLVSLPHNQHTENLIGARELALLGEEGIIINIGRGPVVNEKALYNALKTGVIAGAAIDVWYGYEFSTTPQAKGSSRPYHYPFHELSNIVLSPHRADSPEDDLIRWDDVVYNIRQVVTGKQEFMNVVNLNQGY